jgi:hypothetical protein
LTALVPPDVVTVTSTVPAKCPGEVATIVVLEFDWRAAAGVEPNMTAVAPPRFVPVIVTEVPPVLGPEEGPT